MKCECGIDANIINLDENKRGYCWECHQKKLNKINTGPEIKSRSVIKRETVQNQKKLSKSTDEEIKEAFKKDNPNLDLFYDEEIKWFGNHETREVWNIYEEAYKTAHQKSQTKIEKLEKDFQKSINNIRSHLIEIEDLKRINENYKASLAVMENILIEQNPTSKN